MFTLRHGKATLVCMTVACASVFVSSPTLANELRDGSSKATSTFARTSSLPRCRATQLRVWDFTALESAADYGVIVVRLQNVSTHECSLSGYPSVQGINQWNGAVFTAAHTRDSYMGGWESTKPLPVVTLRARVGVTSFLIDYISGNDIHACPYLNTLRVEIPYSRTVFILTSTQLQACKHFELHPFVRGLTGTAQ
jgi:hypothetical protein